MLRKLILKFGAAWLGRELRAMAEGKRGPGAQRIYLALQGLKTWTGVALGGASVVLVTQGLDTAAAIVASVAAFLVSVGLADRAWRSAPGSWAEVQAYAFLRDHWADVVALLAAVTAALTTCEGTTAAMLARLHVSCGTGLVVVAGIAAFGGWLVGEAKLAEMPRE